MVDQPLNNYVKRRISPYQRPTGGFRSSRSGPIKNVFSSTVDKSDRLDARELIKRKQQKTGLNNEDARNKILAKRQGQVRNSLPSSEKVSDARQLLNRKQNVSRHSRAKEDNTDIKIAKLEESLASKKSTLFTKALLDTVGERPKTLISNHTSSSETQLPKNLERITRTVQQAQETVNKPRLFLPANSTSRDTVTLHSQRAIPKTLIKHRIIVKNLPSTVTAADLESLFKEIGPLLDMKLLTTGVAWITYANETDALTAVQAYDNAIIDKRTLSIQLVQNSSTSTDTRRK